MINVTNTDKMVEASCEIPSSWYWTLRAVPNLVLPREFFAVSNRPIRTVDERSDQPRPHVAHLDAKAVFIWCYYQRRGDLFENSLDRAEDRAYFVPRYPATIARSWSTAEIFRREDAREWDPDNLTWQRVGVALNDDVAATVWSWVATGVDQGVLAEADRVLDSVTIRLL